MAGKLSGMLCRAQDRLLALLSLSLPPEVRAAVVYALGTFLSGPPLPLPLQSARTLSASSIASSASAAGSPSNSLNLAAAAPSPPDAQLIIEDHATLRHILSAVDDPSPLVRMVHSSPLLEHLQNPD